MLSTPVCRVTATSYNSTLPLHDALPICPITYDDGTWHHVAGVLRSGLAELYVDGVLVAQDTTNPITSVRPSTQTTLGRVTRNFHGGIAEARVSSLPPTVGQNAALAPAPP